MLRPIFEAMHLTTEKGFRAILEDGFIRPHQTIEDESITASFSHRKHAMAVNSEYVYFRPYSVNMNFDFSSVQLKHGFVYDMLYIIFKMEGLLGTYGLIPYDRVFRQCVADVYDLSKIRQQSDIVGGNHLNIIKQMLWGSLYNDYPKVECQEDVEALFKERMVDYTPEKMYLQGVEAYMSIPKVSLSLMNEILVKRPVPVQHCYATIRNGTPQVYEGYYDKI